MALGLWLRFAGSALLASALLPLASVRGVDAWETGFLPAPRILPRLAQPAPSAHPTPLLPAQQPAAFLGSWAEFAPHRVWLTNAVYDSGHDRLLCFGGLTKSSETNRVVAYSFANGEWRYLETAGTPPSARYNVASMYDPFRDRLIVFGGFSLATLSFQNDVWELSLSGTPTWTALSPTGTPPAARGLHTVTFDPQNDRMIVYGGSTGPTELGDLWALSLAGSPAWTQLSPIGTPPTNRDSHSAIYDAAGARMIVFGGALGVTSSNEVWSLSLPFGGTPAWTQIFPSGTPPTARFAHTAVHRGSPASMLVFGGHDLNSQILADVWSLNLSGPPAWIQLAPTPDPILGSPEPRSFHNGIFAPAGRPPVVDRMILFAGIDANDQILGDTWQLDLNAMQWRALTPTPRLASTFVHDPVADRLVFFGGIAEGVAYVNEVWTTPLGSVPHLATSWARLATSGSPPTARAGHALIYDPGSHRLVIFGGESALAPYENDLWELSLAGTPTWSPILPSGTPPSPRWGSAAIHDPMRDRLVLFGGRDASGALGDVWTVNLTGPPVWTQIMPSGTPPSTRTRLPAIYDPTGDRMVIFGGDNGAATTYADAWALSFSPSPAWVALPSTGGPPAARSTHTASYDPWRHQMLAFGGGEFAVGPHQDAWAYALLAPEAWIAPSSTFPNPDPRFFVTGLYDNVRDRLLVAGGTSDGVSYLSDLWALDRSDVTDVPAAPIAALKVGPAIPNPFRDRVELAIDLPREAFVRASVHDLAGRLVRVVEQGLLPAGRQWLSWDARNTAGARVARGLYILRVEAGGRIASQRLLLSR